MPTEMPNMSQPYAKAKGPNPGAKYVGEDPEQTRAVCAIAPLQSLGRKAHAVAAPLSHVHVVAAVAAQLIAIAKQEFQGEETTTQQKQHLKPGSHK